MPGRITTIVSFELRDNVQTPVCPSTHILTSTVLHTSNPTPVRPIYPCMHHLIHSGTLAQATRYLICDFLGQCHSISCQTQQNPAPVCVSHEPPSAAAPRVWDDAELSLQPSPPSDPDPEADPEPDPGWQSRCPATPWLGPGTRACPSKAPSLLRAAPHAPAAFSQSAPSPAGTPALPRGTQPIPSCPPSVAARSCGAPAGAAQALAWQRLIGSEVGSVAPPAAAASSAGAAAAGTRCWPRVIGSGPGSAAAPAPPLPVLGCFRGGPSASLSLDELRPSHARLSAATFALSECDLLPHLNTNGLSQQRLL